MNPDTTGALRRVVAIPLQMEGKVPPATLEGGGNDLAIQLITTQ